MHVRVTISPKGLVKSILKFMFFIPPKPKSFNTTNSFCGNNFLTYHFLWRHVGLIASISMTMQVSANVQKEVEKATKYEGNDFIRGCGLGSSSPRVAVRHPYHVVAVYQGRARRVPALI